MAAKNRSRFCMDGVHRFFYPYPLNLVNVPVAADAPALHSMSVTAMETARIILKPMLRKTEYILHILMITLFAFMMSAMQGLSSFALRNCWRTMHNHDWTGFKYQILIYATLIVVPAILDGIGKYISEAFHVKWRADLTMSLMRKYHRAKNYVYLKLHPELSETIYRSFKSKLDNPDHRICVDAGISVKIMSRLYTDFLRSTLDLSFYIGVLLSFSYHLMVPVLCHGMIGAVVAVQIGRKLIQRNYGVAKGEGDLRRAAVHINTDAECIALWNGEAYSYRNMLSYMKALTDERYQFYILICLLRSVQVLLTKGVTIIPLLFAMYLYAKGDIDIPQTWLLYDSFVHVASGFSQFIDIYDQVAPLSTSCGRILHFLEHLEKLEEKQLKPDEECDVIKIKHVDQPPFEVKNVSIINPLNNRNILQRVNIVAEKGHRVLLTGTSGTGKSCLIRAASGIWKSGYGTISILNPKDVLVLSQLMYTPRGSLRDQITFPANVSGLKTPFDLYQTKPWPDDEFLKLLDKLNLGYLWRRNLPEEYMIESLNISDIPSAVKDEALNSSQEWDVELSTGEKQRLAICRVMFLRPKLVLMDEATSALDEANEKNAYEILSEIPDLTIVSVGHRSTLKSYHDLVINMNEYVCNSEGGSKTDQSALPPIKKESTDTYLNTFLVSKSIHDMGKFNNDPTP